MYLIKKRLAGEQCLDHGRRFTTREKALNWMYSNCVHEFAPYASNPKQFKQDYMGYTEDQEECDCFIVVWEDDQETNEFGVVLP